MNKKKRIGRKFLCLIVSLVMVCTLVPHVPGGLAFAEDIQDEVLDQAAEPVTEQAEISTEGTSEEETALPEETASSEETALPEETSQEATEETAVTEDTSENETVAPEETPDETEVSEADSEDEAAAPEETAPAEDPSDEEKVSEEAEPIKTAEQSETEILPLVATSKHFKATVTYGPEAGVPEGAKLVITEFAEGSKAYEEAKDALVADKRGNSVYSLSSEEEQENYGMAAFDLTIYAADGSVVEPDSDVTVNIEVVALPKGADADVLADTMEIQHLNESTGDVVVEKVATVDSAEAAADKSVGEIEVDTAEKTAEAEFAVEGFSTYTITWDAGNVPNPTTTLRWRNGNTTNAQLTVHYVDQSGAAITRPTGIGYTVDTTIANDGQAYSADLVALLALPIADHEFKGVYRDSARTTEITTAAASREYHTGYGGYYTTNFEFFNNSTSVETLELGYGQNSGGDIYLVYEGEITAPHTTVHYGYLAEDGTTFVEFEEQPSPVEPRESNHTYLIYDFEGYEYADHTYYRTTEAVNGANVATNATEIQARLAHNNANGWRYATSGNNFNNQVADGSHIYVVYEKSPEPTTGGHATLEEDTTPPDTPAIVKESTPNGDGTNTIGLSIRGSVVPVAVDKLADVIVIFDVSGSMEYDLSSTDVREDTDSRQRLYAAKAAVRTLANDLLSADNVNSDGEKLIRMGLVTFSTDAQKVTFGGNDFTDSPTTFNQAINGLGHSGGTNWEKALKIANEMAVDSGRETFVVFVTDGDPTFRISRMGATDADLQGDLYNWNNQDTYYVSNNVFGQGSSDTESRNYDAAVIQGEAIKDQDKHLYNIGISSDAQKMRSFSTDTGSDDYYSATSASELEAAFDAIKDAIATNMGWGNIDMHDGITNLTNTVEKSNLVGIGGEFKYYRAPKPAEWDNWTKEQKDAYTPPASAFVEWTTREADGCAAAEYKDGAVEWEMGEEFMLEDGVTYKVTFTAWPSQEAYDILADLNNGTKQYSELTEAQQAQIVPVGNGYSLKTNEPGANTAYNSATVTGGNVTIGDAQTPIGFNEVQPMALVDRQMSVIKEWVDSINTRNRADGVEFYLLVGGKYYQKNGTFADTKDYAYIIDTNDGNSWTDEINIAPGVARNGDILETGHDYKVEEYRGYMLEDDGVTKNYDEYQSYSMEFVSQTVHPMLINGQLTFLILIDDEHQPEAGATTYTVDMTNKRITQGGSSPNYYAVSSGEGDPSGAITAVNYKTSELDITKIIDASASDMTDEELDGETFTFEVTFTVPAGTDASYLEGISYWIYTPDNSGWTLPEYDSEAASVRPDNYTAGSKFGGVKSSTTASGTTVTATVTITRDQVLRFTNLPTGTTYTIKEVKANDNNLADEGYTVSKITTHATGGSSSEAANPGSAQVTGEIEDANTRYYNQYTNQLSADEAELKVEKTVDYPWANGDYEYTFTIAAQNGAPAPEETTVTVAKDSDDHIASFGTIRFTEAGTYTYTITETAGTNNSIQYDIAPKTVTVKVELVSGVLTVTNISGTDVEFDDTTDPVSAIQTIENKWSTITLSGVKTWNDSDSEDRPDSIFIGLIAEVDGEAVTLPDDVETIKEVTADDDWEYLFEGLPKYDSAGNEIEYSIKEYASQEDAEAGTDGLDGYYTVYDDPSTDDDGNYTADVTNSNVTVEFPVKKELVVPAGLDGPEEWSYDITVTGETGKPMPSPATKTVDQDTDTVTFGPMTFTEPGTYEYTVTETGEVQGVTNDADAETGKTVTVTVTEESDGSLSATASSTEASPVTFTNTYGVEPITASFPVKKVMEVPEDLDGPATWSYDITVEAQDDAPEATTMEKTVTNTADTVTFGPFTYTAPGTYTYKVTEDGEYDGVTNDEDAETGKIVTVTVEDDGEGGLTATADYTALSPLIFTNTYDAEPVTASFPVKKILSVPEGLDGPEEWEYTINVTGETGKPMPSPATGTVDQDNDTVTFGPVTYDTPGQYVYTVTETGTVVGVENDPRATTGKTVTVTVEDGGEGQLVATATSTAESPLTFTNTYNVGSTTASFPVKKILSVPAGLTGPEEWEYTITVTGEEGKPMPSPATGTVDQDDDTVTFGPITYDTPGTYTYTVTETGEIAGVTNDEAATTGKTVTVTVVDNHDGTLTATPSVDDETPLTFTNTYDVEPTTASFPVTKILEVPEGLDGPDEWEYTINVTGETGKPMPSPASKTVDQDNDTATFGPITYTAPGTYTYTVTETGEIAGVTNDEAATTGKTVTVTVVDNHDGTLTATASATADEPLTFINTYKVEPTTASFPVTKELVVPEGLEGPLEWSYDIDVAAQNGAPSATVMTGTVDQDNDSVTFGPITYNVPGTYTYKVTETGEIAGVENDEAATTGKTVTVTVVDNKNGTLTATASSTAAKPLKFTNTYSVEPTTASFPVNKILEVPEELEGPDEWEYTINAAAQGGAPVAEVMTGTVDQDNDSVTFGPITYDMPGTYTYKVSEEGKIAGVTNDKQAAGKTVTVTVVDNHDGTLTATASSTTDKPLTFTNKYSVENKEVDVTEDLEKTVKKMQPLTDSVTFDFTIKADTKGAPLPKKDGKDNTSASVVFTKAETKNIDFGTLTFTKPGTYEYTLTENIDKLDGGWTTTGSPAKVTIVVTDNKDGTMGAEVTGAEITNTYETTKVSGTKTWVDNNDQDGIRPESIKVNLFADGKKIATKTVKADEEGNWAYTFRNLPKYKDHSVDKEVKYTVTEDAVPEYETTQDGYDFTNTHEVYKTKVVVTKTWDDADDKDGIRPESVTVRLLANGEELEAAELNEENKWAKAWVNLDANKDGEPIEYTVTEDDVEGYEAQGIDEVTGDAENGYRIKIVNYHKAKPDAVMIDPPVKKVVDGDPKTDATFTFQMKALTEGAPMPEGSENGIKTMEITGSGSKEFGETWFDEAGVWKYEITEIDGGVENYEYDDTVYTLTVTVTEEADGTQYKLVKTETVDGGNGKIVFTNVYEKPPVKTGDTTDFTLYAHYALMGGAALILLLMLLFRRKKEAQ